MAVRIPIVRGADDAARFTLQVTLDGTTYTLEFRWNERAARTDAVGNLLAGAWFMNVLDGEGVQPLMVGLQVVVDYPIAANVVSRTPPGVFIAVDTGAAIGSGVDPGFDDLGNRVKLRYFSFGE